MKKNYDLVFIGGGLANGLAALRAQEEHPELTILIVEQGDRLGGNHTWSFHATDLTHAQLEWIQPFVSKAWPRYEAVFPNLKRIVNSAYHSIRSSRFHEVLSAHHGIDVALRCEARDVAAAHVTLSDGRVIQAGCVVDGRGWRDSRSVPVAYQKFLGLDITLRRPHGLSQPVLMDATVAQEDGYRFFYLLPWSETQILVEDTHYSESPSVNEDEYKEEIMFYMNARGWEIASIDRSESGALSIPLEGTLPPWPSGIPCSGARAGLFHATTGYSVPQAVRFAEAFAHALRDIEPFETARLFDWARSYAERHWIHEGFSRLLNRLLFRAARPEERTHVLEKFYRKSDGLLGRFYAGRLNWWDRLRVFSGKPPISLTKVLPCIVERKIL